MNSNFKSYLLLISCLSVWFQSQAQDEQTLKSGNSFEISLQGAYMVAGELTSIYETALGLEAKYFFDQSGRFKHYVTTGFLTDLGTTGANYFGFHTGIGSQYELSKLWKRPLLLSASAGALYSHESFSTQLINTTVNSTNSEFGFKAQLGLGYQITKHFGFEIQASQWSNLGTSIGLGISYSF